MAGRDDHALDPRHQAGRGRPGPDHRPRRDARALDARAGPPARAGAAPRPRLRQPAVAGGRGRLADLPGAAARLRREGDARGRRPHDVELARRGVRGRRARRRRRGVRRPPRDRRGGGAAHRAGRPGLEQRPRRQAGRAHHARGARRLPGQRAVGAEPGRSGQPALRRLRRPRRPPRLARSWRGGVPDRESGRRRRREARRHPGRADPAPGPPGAVHDLRARRRVRDSGRPRAGIRPGRGGHGGHPAPGRARGWRRLGRRPPRADRRDLAGRHHRRGRDQLGGPRTAAERGAAPTSGRPAGEGRPSDHARPVRRVGPDPDPGPTVGGRCHRRDDQGRGRLVDTGRARPRPVNRGGGLRLPDRRLGHAGARPAVPASAGGRPRSAREPTSQGRSRGPTTTGPAGSWPAR